MDEDTLTLKVAMAQRQSETGYGRARIDSLTRDTLGVDMGDTIEIVGKRTIVAKVFKSQPEDEGRGLIFIDGLMRTSAGVSVDDTVTVKRCYPAPAKKIILAPNIPEDKMFKFDQSMEGAFRNGLLGRPLLSGTDIMVPNIALMGSRNTFSVVSTEPPGPVMVMGNTKISVKETAETRKKDNKQIKKIQTRHVTYDDIGGLDEELRRIREMIELPLKHPELFDRMGIGAPKGVLLYGPPGTGKTLIAEAVANESGASFFSVRGPEIMRKYYGESEELLRDMFKSASDNAPSIIFLDEIDSLAPNRDSTNGDLEQRLVAQLLSLMDGMGDRGNVIVIGATNREDSIDPALRRPGRFDREIEIGIPNRNARSDILQIHLQNMPLTDDVDVKKLADITQGFVGADLAALCREAAMKCLSAKIPELDLDKPIPQDVLNDMRVTMADFNSALTEVEPSGMREVLVEVPKVTWDDVGGLDDVRRQIEEMYSPGDGTSPLEKLGVEPGKGILLYGPPGTGKTLIAKALANQSNVNFISVSGPEIASKWMGESEKAIRQIFKRAKLMAPSIIFFDEMDSIAPIRGNGGGEWEKVVAQLLTSMDGVESMNSVTVMAATNRPDMIDPALLRPGRFDRMVLIGKPDEKSRLAILEIQSKRMPLDDVDLKDIAAKTDGYVGADLSALCREAAIQAYREDKNATKVCKRHFEAALREIPPSVDRETFERYEKMGRNVVKRRSSWDNIPFYG